MIGVTSCHEFILAAHEFFCYIHALCNSHMYCICMILHSFFFVFQVELALGSFPYGKWKTIFDQLNAVVSGPPPTIPEDGRFSPMMVEFVAKW